jgi:hypothetical protein
MAAASAVFTIGRVAAMLDVPRKLSRKGMAATSAILTERIPFAEASKVCYTCSRSSAGDAAWI